MIATQRTAASLIVCAISRKQQCHSLMLTSCITRRAAATTQKILWRQSCMTPTYVWLWQQATRIKFYHVSLKVQRSRQHPSVRCCSLLYNQSWRWSALGKNNGWAPCLTMFWKISSSCSSLLVTPKQKVFWKSLILNYEIHHCHHALQWSTSLESFALLSDDFACCPLLSNTATSVWRKRLKRGLLHRGRRRSTQ